MYDLNHRTVAALDHLAVYETFEDTWDIVAQESAAGDMFFASEEDAADKLGAAQRQQDDALEALGGCRKNMGSACREFSNCRPLHEAACFDVKETGRRHSEMKRKAEEAHTKTCLHRDYIRRATSDHVKAEEVLNNSVGCLRTHVRETANATHALACGVPDRESNETKYLREDTETIEEWQRQLQRGHSVTHRSCDHNEVVFIVRQR